ncbi:MAG TPA: MFS transporter [Anaerolineae bacterium]|nr:MFS transporter [Anaerolineae bacterium]HQJ51987.1 MFS transporter [Anaerolineae bacterium]
MDQDGFRVYGYRWVVLLVFMLVVAVNQLLWITFASITGDAARYYGVSDLQIGLLSLVFMAVYIVVSIPASWAIDTYGLRIGVGIGAVLTGAFGLLRGALASSYAGVLAAQVGIAVGQPFIQNAVTTVAARWFPARERATAAGLGSLAMYVGILMGLALTPVLALGLGMARMLWVYGVISAAAALLFLALARERPPSPPCPPGQDSRSLVTEGLRQVLRNPSFQLLMVVFFIGLGAFNAVTTWIEAMLRPRGFTASQAGVAGAVMILAGIVGALVLPMLSDRARRRTPYLLLAVAGSALGLAAVAFAPNYWLLLLASGVFGFSLLGSGPVGFQYGAELTFPAPEGTSNGLLLWAGQISGILFILGMDALKSPQDGSMTVPLGVLVALMFGGLALCTRLKEASQAGSSGPTSQGR